MKLLREYFQSLGQAGGKKAAKHMTPEQRQERARKAAEARWSKRRKV